MPDDDDLPAGWTDLHLHPIPQEWRPDSAELLAWLTEQSISRLPVVTCHGVADLWDAHDEAPPPIAEHEDLALTELPQILAGAEHCTVLLDPADLDLGDIIAELQRGRQTDWAPCVLSLGYGTTSIPDPTLDRTLARFAFSLAIGGPGLPHNCERASRAIPALPPVQELRAALEERFGQRFTAHLCFADG